MSRYSWRQYGGKSKIDYTETLNVGTIVADQFLSRSVSAITNTFDNIDVLNEALIRSDAKIGVDLSIGNNVYISNSLHVKNKLYFGIDLSNIPTPYTFMYGNQTGIGINTTNLSSTFNVYDPTNINVLTVGSGANTIRNIVGQNINNKGVVISVDDSSSNIGFYNDSTTNVLNNPGGLLKYYQGGYLKLSTSINIDLSANSIYSNFSNGTLILDSNGSNLTTTKNVHINSNNLFFNSSGQILIDVSGNNSSVTSFLLSASGAVLNTNGNVFINAVEGIVNINTVTTEISSNLIVSKKGIFDNLYNESSVIYDSSNNTYLYTIYDISSVSTGNALTLVALDNSSNTVLRAVAPNYMGLALGGGVFPTDTTRSYASMSLSDSSKNYIPSYTIVSGKDEKKYLSTIGINSYSPKTEQFVLDINGPTHIGNGEMQIVNTANFTINHLKFSKSNYKTGIAVGTASRVDGIYEQNILYSNDGGLTWSISILDVGNISSVQDNSFNSLYVYDNSFSITGTRQNLLYYTYDGGVNWYQMIYPNNSSSTFYRTITSCFVKLIDNYYRFFSSYYYTNPASGTFYNYPIVIQYYDISVTNVDSLFGTTIDLSNSSIKSGSILPNIYLNNCDSSGNYIYYSGNGIVKLSSLNPTLSDSEAYIKNTGYVYYNIFTYDDSNVIAVGDNILSWTTNGSLWYNQQLSLTTIGTAKLRSVFIYDLYIAMAVGDNGVIIYSTNWSSSIFSWNIVPQTILNTSGIANLINGNSSYLRGISMHDLNSFFVASVTSFYNPTTFTLGSSKILYGFFPNLFNRVNNDVLDVSGNMFISGDININDGGELRSNNNTFYMLEDTSAVKQIYFGNLYSSTAIAGNLFVGGDVSFNTKLNIIGDVSINSRLFVGDDVSLNSRLTVYSDVSFNNRLFVGGDVSLNSRLTVYSDVSLNARLFIAGDVSLNQRLFVSGDVSLNGNVVISKDLLIAGKLSVQQYTNTSIINTTTTNYNSFLISEDLSLNGRLFVYSDASLNKRVFIGGDVSMNSKLTVYSDVSFNSNLFVGGDVSLNSRLVVYSDVSFNDRLFVGGDVSLNSRLTVYSDVSFNNRLFVGGDASLNSRLTVYSDVSFNNRLFVGGDVSLNARLVVYSDVSFNNRLFVGGDVSLNSRLVVYSDVSFNKRLFVGGDVSLNSRLTVYSDVSFNNRLFVGGDVSLNSRLIVYSDVSFNNRLFVGSDVSLNSRLTVYSDVSLNSRLFVGGDVSFNSRLAIYSDLTVYNGRTVYSNYYDVNMLTQNTNITIGDNASTISIGRGQNAGNKTIYIGGAQYATPSAYDKIYIGGVNDTVIFSGSMEIQTITSSNWQLPGIILNTTQSGYNSTSGSSYSSINPTGYSTAAGIFIRDFSDNYAGMFAVTNDTSGYYFKAPGSENIVNLNIGKLKLPSGNPTQLNINNNITNGIMVLSNDPDPDNNNVPFITVKPIDISNIFLRDYTSTNTYQQILTNVGVSGDLTLMFGNRLFVGGDVSFNGNLYVSNTMSIDTSGNLYPLDVSGTTNLRGTVNPITLIDNSVLLSHSLPLDFSNNFGTDWVSVYPIGSTSTSNWNSISISANGQYQTATKNGDYIYISNNYGISWNMTYLQKNWGGVSISANGQYQTAYVNRAYIYISSNFGSSFTPVASQQSWLGISISSTGQYQSAIYNPYSTIASIYSGGYIYTSTDYGNTWNPVNSTGSKYWSSIAVSSTGQYQTAVSSLSPEVQATIVVYISNNFGKTFTPISTTWAAASINTSSISISATGQYQAIAVNNSNIYISNNYGASWSTTATSDTWSSISMSANGQYLIATANNNYIVTSVNYGNTWTNNSTVDTIYSAAMSSDGQYLTSISNYSTGALGYIYSSKTPVSTLSVSNFAIFGGDVSFNSRIFVNGDAFFNSRLFITSTPISQF